MVHDPRELAELALTLARQFSDHELELRALADQGLAWIGQGRVAAGFAQLDEVLVAVTAGEIANPETRAMTLCALLSACERTGDAARADYWCRRIEDEPYLHEVPILNTHCLVASGAVEATLGHWESAEAHLQAALQSHARSAHHTASAVARLAELRLEQDRPDEAAALLAGHEDEFEVLPTLARLRLVEGKPAAAAALLQTVARGLGTDRIRLAPVLGFLVEAALASGQTAAGRSDPAGLTPREREVLRLIAVGKSNREIAGQLVLSVRTVERHLSTIYEKLGATGKTARAAATAYALRHGLG